MARLNRWFDKGRRLRSDSLTAYLMLYVLGGMKGWRRRTLRHRQEQDHLQAWLDTAMSYRAANYDLAVEVLRCRRLVKGYSDTHSRGLSKFDRVLEGIALVANRSDAADWARRLREAGYAGELRALGPVIADQYAMLRRCGIDAAEIPEAIAERQPWPQWQARANWRAHDYQSRLKA